MYRYQTVSLSALIGVIVLVGFGCGPSFRRTEQSDNAFLRCFDMDYHPGRTAEQKEACWSRWLDRHVYNQPPDKVAYAELRIEELDDGISVPGPPGPPGAFHQRFVPAAGETPPDTSALVSTVEDDEVLVEPEVERQEREPAADADAGVTVDIDLSPPPGILCAKACRHSFEMCVIRCGDEDSTRCREACEAGRHACTESCSP